MPIAIRIIPPIASAHLPMSLPALIPARKPSMVTTKAVAPIIKLAITMFTVKKAKPSPTANASILVATDNVSSKRPLVISVFADNKLMIVK